MKSKQFRFKFPDSTEFVPLDAVKAQLQRQLKRARNREDATTVKLIERELKHLGRQSGNVGHAASRAAVNQKLNAVFAQAYESLYAKNPKRSGYRNLEWLAQKICRDETLRKEITPATARAWHQRNRRPTANRG